MNSMIGWILVNLLSSTVPNFVIIYWGRVTASCCSPTETHTNIDLITRIIFLFLRTVIIF